MIVFPIELIEVELSHDEGHEMVALAVYLKGSLLIVGGLLKVDKDELRDV